MRRFVMVAIVSLLFTSAGASQLCVSALPGDDFQRLLGEFGHLIEELSEIDPMEKFHKHSSTDQKMLAKIELLKEFHQKDDGAELLRQSDIDLEEKDEVLQATLLIWAAMMGQLEVVKFLVAAGARVDAVNKDNQTAADCVRATQKAIPALYKNWLLTAHRTKDQQKAEVIILSASLENCRKILAYLYSIPREYDELFK